MLSKLWAQPREDTGLSPAEAVFGAPVVLFNEFWHNEEISVGSIIKNCSKILHVPAVSLPRHNSSAQLPSELPSELPAEILSAPLIWVRRGGVISPFKLLYDGPYTVLRCGPCSFTIRVGSRDKVIAISRLKACMAADAEPGSLCRHGRPPGSHPGISAATKRSHFQTRWFLHLPFQRRHETVQERFYYPAQRFLHARDRRRHHRCHRRSTRPVNGHPTAM